MNIFVVVPTLLTLGVLVCSAQEFVPDTLKANLTLESVHNVTVDCTDENIAYIYEDAITCVNLYSEKEIVAMPKDEFLSVLEQCTKYAIAKQENCIPNKDFLEFLSPFIKSVVTFQYENYDIINIDFEECLYKDEASVWKCYDDTYENKNNTEVITSKQSFCSKTVSFMYCIRDVVMNNCEQTPNLKKLGDAVVNAIKTPCGM